MGIEIERKFLPSSDAWRAAAHKTVAIAQGYLNDIAMVDSGAMQASVRVRIEGDAAFLNIKSRELGARRQEFEYPIPVADAQALLALCVGGKIEKIRHYVQHQHHLWEVDEFFGDNAGLVVAEIELSSVDETFAKPDWAGAEATHAQRYYNLALASRAYSQWCDNERQARDLNQGH